VVVDGRRESGRRVASPARRARRPQLRFVVKRIDASHLPRRWASHVDARAPAPHEASEPRAPWLPHHKRVQPPHAAKRAHGCCAYVFAVHLDGDASRCDDG
jgi:hypothetical protein